MLDILINILFAECAIVMALLLGAVIFLGISLIIEYWEASRRTKKKDKG